MPARYSIADAKNHLARVVHEVEAGPPVELTRRGKPVAVIVSVREFQRFAGKTGSFASALRKFRKKHDLRRSGIDPKVFRRLRDRSPGREVKV